MNNKTGTKIELIKTGKDFLYYLPTKIVPALLAFISIPIFTRLLGVENYGVLALIMVFVTLSTTLISNWISSPIIRFLPKYQRLKKQRIFISTLSSTIWLLTLILSLIIFSVLIIFKSKFSGLFFNLLLIATGQIFFISVFNCFNAFFRADRKPRIYTLYIMISSSSSLILSIIFLYLGWGPRGVIIGNIIPAIILSIVITIQIFKNFHLNLGLFSKKIIKEALSFGLPLILSGISAWILSFSDRYLLKYFLGNAQVGVYSASYDLVNGGLGLIIGSFILASTPSLVNFWEKHRGSAPDFLSYLNRLFVLIILPFVILLTIIAKPLILLLTPADFHAGYQIIYLVSFGVFFWGFYLLAYTGLYLAKKTWLIAVNILAMALVNIILNIILIPKMAITGSALATLISYLLIFISSIILVKNILPWHLPPNFSIFKITMAIILPLIPSIIILKTINTHIIGQIIITSLVYLGLYVLLLYLTKVFYPGEITIIKNKFRFLKKEAT